MSTAQLLVLVHDLVGQPVKATVEYMAGKKRTFRKLDYDEGLQRHVGRLDPGACKLRVQGLRGTSEEQRDLVLVGGDNHISVMVAEPDLPALHTPLGNCCFKTRPNEHLLHVTGRGARERTSAILKKSDLTFEAIVSRAEISDDDVLFRVSLSGPKGKEIEKLECITSESLPELGLTAPPIEDKYARQEWGWHHRYSVKDMVDQFLAGPGSPS